MFAAVSFVAVFLCTARKSLAFLSCSFFFLCSFGHACVREAGRMWCRAKAGIDVDCISNLSLWANLFNGCLLESLQCDELIGSCSLLQHLSHDPTSHFQPTIDEVVCQCGGGFKAGASKCNAVVGIERFVNKQHNHACRDLCCLSAMTNCE